MLRFHKFTFPQPGYQGRWVDKWDHADNTDDSEQENGEQWALKILEMVVQPGRRDLSVQV